MKITVIGLGSIGKRHLKTLSSLRTSEDIDEIRCFDKNTDRMNQATKDILNIKTFPNLENAVDGVDLIFLCVPTSLHYPLWNEIKDLGDFDFYRETAI